MQPRVLTCMNVDMHGDILILRYDGHLHTSLDANDK